jgi:hypothetical protein
MISWIQHRIAWIEANSDPYSISRLKEMVRKRPCDGFPVTNAPGQIPHGDVCEAIATTPVDQRLWFLAHSWLFVGVDWNADYYSSAKVSHQRLPLAPQLQLHPEASVLTFPRTRRVPRHSTKPHQRMHQSTARPPSTPPQAR